MDWLKGLLSPITKIFTAREDRKKTKEILNAKIKMQKEEGNQKIELSSHEWDMLSKQMEPETWKDEWITLIVTIPIPVIFIAVIASVIIGDPIYAEAAKAGTDAIKELVPNYQDILMYTILAGLGLKMLIKR